MGLFSKLFGSYSDRELKRIMPIAKAVEAKEEEYGRLSDEQLRHKTEELKARLRMPSPRRGKRPGVCWE